MTPNLGRAFRLFYASGGSTVPNTDDNRYYPDEPALSGTFDERRELAREGNRALTAEAEVHGGDRSISDVVAILPPEIGELVAQAGEILGEALIFWQHAGVIYCGLTTQPAPDTLLGEGKSKRQAIFAQTLVDFVQELQANQPPAAPPDPPPPADPQDPPPVPVFNVPGAPLIV